MRVLLAVAFALAVAGPVDAYDCTTWSTSQAEATVDLSAAGGSTYYEVDVACWALGWVSNHAVGCGDTLFFVYEETNGLPGLQRADEIVDDTCHGMVAGDTIVL